MLSSSIQRDRNLETLVRLSRGSPLPVFHDRRITAIRNSVAVFDTSPLFKYRLTRPDCVRFLQTVMVRDIAQCPVGSAQYTCWCDPDGFVLQDGVILRVAEEEFWLTAAEPSLRYFRSTASKLEMRGVEIRDISNDYGILAIQGPHAFSVVSQLTAAATTDWSMPPILPKRVCRP